MDWMAVAELAPAAFAAFGEVGMPLVDGAHGEGDVALDLSQEKPRLYIMRLHRRGISFDRLARHDRVTQCLGAVDGLPWLIAVAPAGIAAPTAGDIRAFSVPGDRFIMLAHGTWHAGPYFTENLRDLYNLEPAHPNPADYTG